MARTDAIKVEGVVVEALPNGTCQVELANGHRLRAWGVRRRGTGLTRVAAGDKIILEMSPYDLSSGRVVGAAKQTK